jgi:hypothetical protein
MTKLYSTSKLAERIGALAERLSAIERRKCPEVPRDIARISDIPARTTPPPASDITPQLQVLRDDLTETRRWLAEMGRSWQAHRGELDRRIADLAARIPDVSGVAMAADIPDITGLARTSDIPAVPDLAPLAERVLSVEKELADLADRIPDDETITSIADARAGARVGPVKGRLTQLWASLGAEADRIDAIRSDISEIKESLLAVQSRKCPAIPDSPEPVDVAAIASALASLAGRCEQIENDMESMRRAIQCAAPSEAVDDLAARQASIRETLTETRRWLADLGRKVQGGKS